MKTKLIVASLVMLCLTTTTSFAQNRWGILGGINLSTSLGKDYGWRPGGYVGALYDIHLSDAWYIQPQLLYSYEEYNSSYSWHHPKEKILYTQHALTLPVLASLKLKLGGDFALRINAGPYVQYAMFGCDGKYGEWYHASFGDRFTYGLKGGFALEHKHWLFSLDSKYSFRKFYTYDGHGMTLSAGIGYKF